MPALPGAANSRSTAGSRASFHARACSRPPCPTTRTFTRRGLSREHQGLFAGWADRDGAHLHAAELADPLHVVAGLPREVQERAHPRQLLLPALGLLVDGLRRVEERLV